MDFRDRIIKSVEKHSKLELRENAKITKRNNKPEKQVVLDCLHWMKENGFDMAITDSSRTEFGGSKISVLGFSDSCGDHQGLACFVEFKAPKKLYTLRENQYYFLKRKIERYCFACVTDSVARLAEIWLKFCLAKDPETKREVLIQYLPKPSSLQLKNTSNVLIDDDLPF